MSAVCLTLRPSRRKAPSSTAIARHEQLVYRSSSARFLSSCRCAFCASAVRSGAASVMESGASRSVTSRIYRCMAVRTMLLSSVSRILRGEQVMGGADVADVFLSACRDSIAYTGYKLCFLLQLTSFHRIINVNDYKCDRRRNPIINFKRQAKHLIYHAE